MALFAQCTVIGLDFLYISSNNKTQPKFAYEWKPVVLLCVCLKTLNLRKNDSNSIANTYIFLLIKYIPST